MSAPTLPRGHEVYEELAVAWAIDALEPADQETFEAHRGGCDRCARTVLDTLEVAAELAYGVPDLEPPPTLRTRVLAAVTAIPLQSGATAQTNAGAGHANADVEQTNAGGRTIARSGLTDAGSGRVGGGRVPAGATGRPSRDRSEAGRHAQDRRRPVDNRPKVRKRRRLVSALVALALIGGSAVTTWEIARPDSSPAVTAERFAALSAQSGQGTIATVVVRAGQANVVTDGLTPNTGRGTDYYVWGVPADGAGMPQVVGTFTVTTSGLHSYPVRLTRALDDYPVLAVSEERAGSTPTAPSKVLARGALGR